MRMYKTSSDRRDENICLNNSSEMSCTFNAKRIGTVRSGTRDANTAGLLRLMNRATSPAGRGLVKFRV